MQRPNTGRQSSRRAYNRNNNNSFKFHNFVFNQDNQSFCLEEQHGNKKITVLHWKKDQAKNSKELRDVSLLETKNSDDPTNRPPTSTSFSIGDTSNTSNFTNEREMNSPLISPMTTSFPSSMFHLPSSSLPSSNHHFPSPLALSSSGALFATPLEHASSSGVFSARSLTSSLSQSSTGVGGGVNLDLITKSTTTTTNTSSSSAYGTNFSSFASYCSSSSKEGDSATDLAGCTFKRAAKQIVMDNEEEEEEEYDDDGSAFEDDEMDSDTEDFKSYLSYRDQIKLYSRLMEQQSQPLDLSLKERTDYNNNHNFSTNRNRTEDSKDDDETLSICESFDSYKSYNSKSDTLLSSKCFRFAPNISISKSDLDLHNMQPIMSSVVREEATSPSLLISSVKLGSPTPATRECHATPRPTLANPFMFPMTSHQMQSSALYANLKQQHQQQSTSPRHSLLRSPPPVLPTTSAVSPPTHLTGSTSQPYYYHPPQPRPQVKPYSFDTFLEDEIYKILQSSNSMSSPSPSATSSASTSSTAPTEGRPTSGQQQPNYYDWQYKGIAKRTSREEEEDREQEDEYGESLLTPTTTSKLEENIKVKLKRLQREILHQKDLFDSGKFATSSTLSSLPKSSNRYRSGNGLEGSQDHLKLHFKFDANKNLEPYRGSGSGGEGGKQQQQQQLSQSTIQSSITCQSPLITSQQAQPNSYLINQMSRNRLNQRNQIKRQLEEAFKQNGFLVKTKQVSDANNSAMFCKFRQLRKYTRYYLKSWQNHLPEEVNKLWKGFLPPKTERSMFHLADMVGDGDADADVDSSSLLDVPVDIEDVSMSRPDSPR